MAKRISRVTVVISDSKDFNARLADFLRLSNLHCGHLPFKPLKLKRSWRKKFNAGKIPSKKLVCEI